jgi:hypothetical protein
MNIPAWASVARGNYPVRQQNPNVVDFANSWRTGGPWAVAAAQRYRQAFQNLQNRRRQSIQAGTDPYRLANGGHRNEDRRPTYGLAYLPNGQMYQRQGNIGRPDPTIGGVQNFPNMNNYMSANTKPIMQQGLSDIYGGQNPWAKLGWKI